MEKNNIAELLKDCPSGMELNCLMYEDVYFDYVDTLNIIHCYIQHKAHKTYLMFNQHGTPDDDIKSKCVIFPKGKTTWEGFVPPYKFKDGDVVATDDEWIGITTGGKIGESIPTYCVIKHADEFEAYLDRKETWVFHRLATEEEKQKLFDAIKSHGYVWNDESKNLEKLPKFKVGDKIVKKGDISVTILISKVDDECYYSTTEGSIGLLPIAEQDDWELVPNKFNITTLKAFKSEVLVRNYKSDYWKPAIFGFTEKDKNVPFFVVGGNFYYKCIPYEGNEHLLGTTNDCDDFYKTWE